jgi:hypothetical protein
VELPKSDNEPPTPGLASTASAVVVPELHEGDDNSRKRRRVDGSPTPESASATSAVVPIVGTQDPSLIVDEQIPKDPVATSSETIATNQTELIIAHRHDSGTYASTTTASISVAILPYFN